MSGYPPYAPYEQDEPPPPSVAEMVTTGHKTRVQHKSKERKPAHPMPNPARPRGPKATDVELSARAMRCHARCIRKHNAVLTDRMARMARPPRRQVINMWREYANTLPPQAINRFRNFLGADEPFKPEQAYELFLNQRKGRKANKANKCKRVQKELRAMCGDRRYVWARKATVSFARGIQHRLAKPGVFELEDGMVRLSNIILNDLSCHMKIRPPSRRTRCPKSKMVIEVADKVAVWIQEILTEADDRMLMMDFDEDDEVLGRYDGYHDDFLDMMGGRGVGLGGAAGKLKGALLDAFNFLIEAMSKKGDKNLIQYDKFRETFKEAANELKKAPTFEASGYSAEVAKQLRRELESAVDSSTPPELRAAMTPMIAMAADYLAQVAEQNKKKGAGYKHLISALKQKPNEVLFQKGKIAKTNAQAAKMLEQAKDLEADHDDPNLAQELHSKLTKVANDSPSPDNLKSDLAESIGTASKYLSQAVSDEAERGPAFNQLLKELEKKPLDAFVPEFGAVATKHHVAHVLKSAPGLTTTNADKEMANKFKAALQKSIGSSTPGIMKKDMDDVINRCADYLAEFVVNRGIALNALLHTMKSQPSKELAKRVNYALSYGEGAKELETAQAIVPTLPIKDIADEIKTKLAKDVETSTPPELKKATGTLIKDVADVLSQNVALKSGVAGANYNTNFLKATKAKEGDKALQKYKDMNLETLKPEDFKAETPEEKGKRLAAEKILGRPETTEERARRISAEKRLGRPETAEEIQKRIAEDNEKKYGSETETQKQARMAAENILGRPEAPEERQRRLEAEKRLGRPETPEEMRQRIAEQQAAGTGGGGGGGGPPETEEKKATRIAAEHILGRPETSEEKARRLSAEKRLGRPETPEEIQKRVAAENEKKHGPETQAQQQARMAAENILGRPEAPEERQRRLEAEKRLGRPETPEEMRQRIAEEQAAGTGGGGGGPPETEAQKATRIAAENILGRPETSEEKARRLSAEKRLGRPETPEEKQKRVAAEDEKKHGPETQAQQQARMAAENILGRPEAPEERQRRLEAEKRQGRPETPEEMRKRIAEEQAAGTGGGGGGGGPPEAGAQKATTVAAGNILGRPETSEETARRLSAEKRLGRPETPEEIQKRVAAENEKKHGPETQAQQQAKMAAENILGRPEAPEERQRRLEAEKRLGRPETPEEMRQRIAEEQAAGTGGGGPPKTEAQKATRVAAENILGRPETSEEKSRRLSAEKRLGRPETPEEIQKRVAAENEKKHGPETQAQQQARMAAENILGRPETPEERQRRLEAEKRLGRPETPEEMRKRIAEEQAAGIGGGPPETEEEKKTRLEAEQILGRPETLEERARRLSAQRRLGRPETAEEIKKRMATENEKKYGPETQAQQQARMAAENILGRPEAPEERQRRLEAERRLGRPETQEEMKRRLADERRAGIGGGEGPPETEGERKRGMEVEKILGRPETKDERLNRLAAEKRLGRSETSEEMRVRLEAEAAQRAEDERLGITPEMRRRLNEEARRAQDPEHQAALQTLHKELKAKRNEKLYEQPQTDTVLTYGDASDWLKTPPVYVDKSVRNSGDTARLAQKFERKLGFVVDKSTPEAMKDVMQDVVIESSRNLSEYFVAKSYKAAVENSLIAEMQKRDNDNLVGENGTAETSFFAAQRLKLADLMESKAPNSDVTEKIERKLDAISKSCAISRNMIPVLKDHVNHVSDYLSEHVGKPNPRIEAYVRLLDEMEKVGGDEYLVDGNIKKTYKEAATYLRQLTSFKDKLNRPDGNLYSTIDTKLSSLMKNVTSDKFTPTTMQSAISENARLLTSYISSLDAKTEALRVLVEKMDEDGDNVLLRHGIVRKTFKDGAITLRGKTADQLEVPKEDVDPVPCRKLQIKLENFMEDKTPPIFADVMDSVIEDVTKYLATALLHPQNLKVCKCMKNVFVQCELWCEEILRRLAKPCCVCSRVISTAAIDDLIEPGVRVRVVPGTSTVSTPGVDIIVKPCPMLAKHPPASASCPIVPNAHCCPGLAKALHRSTTSYMVYETMRNKHQVPTRLPRADSQKPSISYSPTLESQETVSSFDTNSLNAGRSSMKEENKRRTLRDIEASIDKSVGDAPSKDTEIQNTPSFLPAQETTEENYESGFASPTGIYSIGGDDDVGLSLSGFVSSIETQEVTTEQMSDWHALLVSLMWNVQAWRGWLQDNINRGLNYCYIPGPAQGDDKSILEEKDCWNRFQRKVIQEALQWRQYNIFSRQLTLRLALRYRDKEILSPDRGTKKTKEYLECQREILSVISMFNQWTQWLMSIVKEAENIKPTASGTLSSISSHPERWHYFKRKVEQNSADWTKYKTHLKVVWERKYSSILSEWLPSWQQPGPVWVVSACGAVPSGAVIAGEHDHELIFVARTMHKGTVYPAALLPAKHCCIVYAEGTTFYYTKYQVMCNASVRWIKWRAGEVAPRAVRVSTGVHVGRVRYRGTHLLGTVSAPAHRCHVVILGRAFAFNYYDLLVLADEHSENENK